jgi:23S rRNA maturation mini-RNase III
MFCSPASCCCCCCLQAQCYQLLQAADWLTSDEVSLLRWGCNSSSVTPPAHATRQQYKQATALEVLVSELSKLNASHEELRAAQELNAE